MSRYIDADDITKRIQSRIGYFEMYYPNATKNIGELQNCLEIVNEIPTAEVNPMQVELEADGYADGKLVYDFGECPKCGWQFEEGDKDWEEPYCCHCGQRLKWFEESEEEE